MQESDNQHTHQTSSRYSMPQTKTQKAVGTVFGIIMILIYVGMGILLLINFFNWTADWAWTRYVVGTLLIIYGFWRAYRQYAGIDSRF